VEIEAVYNGSSKQQSCQKQKDNYSTAIDVLVEMTMTRWEFRISPCLTGGSASATCHKMLVMRFAEVH